MSNKKKVRGFTTLLVPSLVIMAGCTAYEGLSVRVRSRGGGTAHAEGGTTMEHSR